MDSQKRENLLNMALEATEEERLKSPALGVGYDFEDKTWELIVRHFGDIGFLEEMGVEVTQLLNGYAILRAPEGLVDQISAMGQIEYMEKPKRLYFAVNMGRTASCLTQAQEGGRGLTGAGVLVAVIDSGAGGKLMGHRTIRQRCILSVTRLYRGEGRDMDERGIGADGADGLGRNRSRRA